MRGCMLRNYQINLFFIKFWDKARQNIILVLGRRYLIHKCFHLNIFLIIKSPLAIPYFQFSTKTLTLKSKALGGYWCRNYVKAKSKVFNLKLESKSNLSFFITFMKLQ